MTNTLPVTKGQNYKIDIAGLGHSGEGVGRYQNFTVFVPGALPGEQVTVQISEVKKNYAKARLVKVDTASPDRVVPDCELFASCGGCQLQHLDYQAQLAAKRQTVVDAVNRIGGLADVIVHPTLGAAQPWYYRNKMQFPVGGKSGRITIGCYTQGTHNIINVEDCLIQHQANNLIAAKVRAIANELEITPYNERTGQGVLRHVLGRVGCASGEAMVVLVTATPELPQRAELIAALRDNIPGLVSIAHNINTRNTNVILGNRTKTLWGQNTITDKLGEFTFHISAQSFFQVNTAQAAILYTKAVEYAGLTGSQTVIDAYCGTGTITLFLARQAVKVYGIEIVESAIHDAKLNAKINNISNTEFIIGDAVEIMPQLYQDGIRPHAIVVDPPRAGCAPAVLEAFANMQPERIVYVSCNPASLARDLAVLDSHGYKAKQIQPVDMFPQTYHVETVTLLQRKETTK
ncbi:MAG: methyltransferase, TrmA family [Firmicutes bacterium]|nr:methyltransferase, TrmA family [Bacillota bacterium]